MWLQVGLLQFKLSTPPPASSVFQALIETPGSLPAPLEGPAGNSVIQGHLRIMTAIHPSRPQSSIFGSSWTPESYSFVPDLFSPRWGVPQHTRGQSSALFSAWPRCGLEFFSQQALWTTRQLEWALDRCPFAFYFFTLALEFNNCICSQVDVELLFHCPLMKSLECKVYFTTKCLEKCFSPLKNCMLKWSEALSLVIIPLSLLLPGSSESDPKGQW